MKHFKRIFIFCILFLFFNELSVYFGWFSPAPLVWIIYFILAPIGYLDYLLR
ncbi:hypothetical protein [uncultured Gammaproteobacteria bacterium]|nr:hypothetical protein [uncultured Gammaproteobacteria bacterium]